VTAPTADGLEPAAPKPVAGWSRRLTPAVFLVLSLPTFSHLLRDDMSLETGAIRCLIALVAAVFGMQLLESLVGSYTKEPEPAVAEPVDASPVAAEPPPARRADDAGDPA
jgi:hypothetical protein